MQIQQNISLKSYNTFAINVTAKEFAVFSSLEELQELLAYNINNNKLIIGGGSNILFTKNFDGLVLKNEIKGIELIKEDNEYYYIKAAAGEVWHSFVLYCIQQHYFGIENLSLIPGNVGASPMQNIGAYGVEVKDIFYELEAYHLTEKKRVYFNLQECKFGYRESVFKTKFKNQFVILNVTFRLRKIPVYNISYGAIQQELERMKITQVSAQAISNAVIHIRSSKLPNPKEIGNAGSFFKNPVIPNEQFEQLKKFYPHLQGYKENENYTKIAAAWLIEQSGWKGYRKNDAGCHNKQALVLVNYGNAVGSELIEHAKRVQSGVKEKFNIELEMEVNII